MADRPFLDPKLRFAVNVPQAEERFTVSIEDTLMEEVSLRTRQRDVVTGGEIITNFIKGDEVIFDIEDNVASVQEINIIQEEIINAFDNFTAVDITEDDIVVKAEIVRVLTFGLGE